MPNGIQALITIIFSIRITMVNMLVQITEEKYRVQENEIETKIINKTAEIDRANDDKDQSADEIRLMMNIFKDYNDTQAYREKILSEAIDTITVSDGELIFNMLGGLKFTERLGTYERT